uniref:Uncharacterized protein n=1 Tax=Panagrolaimus davidi TaxID=227884 RepID=A0A914PHK7_9BILA
MNFFKLLLIFTLVLFGTFGQRFLRHSINDDALFEEKDSDKLLSSDGINAQQVGDDVQFTGYIKEIELELKYNELMFEYCSKRIPQNRQRCMGQRVYVCYDAESPDISLQGECRPNQCRFEAGISPGVGKNFFFMWFMMPLLTTDIPVDKDICESAKMKSPEAEASRTFSSCKPLITNGKIKLSVREATPKCFMTVKNAKIWTPTTTQSPTTQASPASEAKGTKDEASNATLIWAIVGVILFILLIGIVAAGAWYFCVRKQNKTVVKKMINVETPKHTVEVDVVQEKKEPVKPKEGTVEKKKAIGEENKSKAAKKGKKLVQRIQLKPSKEVTQNDVTKEVPSKKVKAPIEPTLDDPITGASITAQENEQPHVFVPKTVIHPAPLQPASKAITQYSRSSSRKGSLSGRHEIGMQIMAESTSELVKHTLNTESGMEEEPTQDSKTRLSKKNRKKQSGGGKKKHSKKRR